MSTQNENKLVDRKQFDRVQAAIWQQESKMGNSNEKLYSFSLSRSYKNDKGEWCRTHSFAPRDLPHIVLAVNWAMEELLMKPR
jgi:hypothetical protein